MSVTPSVLVALSCVTSLAACLDRQQGAEGARDTGEDAPNATDGTDGTDASDGSGDTGGGADSAIDASDTAPDTATETSDTTPIDVFEDVTPTCAAGCDDGDPCTDDGCIEGQCAHDVLTPCMRECTAAGLLDLYDLRNSPPMPPFQSYVGTWLATHGVVQMGLGGSCTDDGICNCHARPALVDGPEIELTSAGPEDESTMFCASHDASAPPSPTVGCEPFAVGAAYRVWGIGTSEWGGEPGGGAVPVVPVTGLAVEGYCLDTAGSGLAGRYRATVEDQGTTWAFDAEIVENDADCDLEGSCNAFELHLLDGVCPSCPIDFVETVPRLERLDNGLRFTAAIDGGDAVVVRLASVGNALSGVWIDEAHAWGPMWGRLPEGGIRDFAEAPRTGSFVLERQPSATPRSPCPFAP